MCIYKWMLFCIYAVLCQSSQHLKLNNQCGHWVQTETPAFCICSWVPVGVNEYMKGHNCKIPQSLMLKHHEGLTIHSTWMIDGLQNSNYKDVKEISCSQWNCYADFLKMNSIYCISTMVLLLTFSVGQAIWISLWVWGDWFKLPDQLMNMNKEKEQLLSI